MTAAPRLVKAAPTGTITPALKARKAAPAAAIAAGICDSTPQSFVRGPMETPRASSPMVVFFTGSGRPAKPLMSPERPCAASFNLGVRSSRALTIGAPRGSRATITALPILRQAEAKVSLSLDALAIVSGLSFNCFIRSAISKRPSRIAAAISDPPLTPNTAMAFVVASTGVLASLISLTI